MESEAYIVWQIYLDPVTHMLLATEERPQESPRVGKMEWWVEVSRTEKGLQLTRESTSRSAMSSAVCAASHPTESRERGRAKRRRQDRKQSRFKEARQRLLRRAYSIYKNKLQLLMLEDRADTLLKVWGENLGSRSPPGKVQNSSRWVG